MHNVPHRYCGQKKNQNDERDGERLQKKNTPAPGAARLVEFFLQFKKLKDGVDVKSFSEIIELEKHNNKQLQHFSSGMRQRVKLGLAILADTPLLLLDEPVSHLDKNAILWYQKLLQNNISNRTLFVASNSQADEIFLCRGKMEF